MSSNACGNCDTPLTGPYCAQCGQHAHESARSLAVLLHEAWHLYTHLDGRFWSTLVTLLSRPGLVTRDYFAERRARYVPPFRLYFVLSLLFFALASLDTHVVRPLAVPANEAGRADAQKLSAQDAADIREALEEARSAAPAIAAHLRPTDQGVGVAFSAADCDRLPVLQALRSACRRQFADSGRSMVHTFVSYIPRMMFVFLPLMALVMVPLYRHPRRYYVEHLVFFLHAQAALFTIMILDLLLGMAAGRLPWLNAVASGADIAVACYAAWYIYRSMRCYYDESRASTFGKLAVVGFAYLSFLGVLVSATLLLSALTA